MGLVMPGLQAYTQADLDRLRSVQANQGRTAPRVREPVVNGRRVRLVRRFTDAPGVVVFTREYRERKDVNVVAPLVRGTWKGLR